LPPNQTSFYNDSVKLQHHSKVGHEILIITGVVAVIVGLAALNRYQQRIYEQGLAACIEDCSHANGGFRRYFHNLFGNEQCICSQNQQVGDIWN